MTTEWQALALPGCEPEMAATETAVDWSTGEVFRVHQLAARFPMLPEDELTDLAGDIKENGLAQPIVLNEDRVLIDGRNRLKACELARVAPQYMVIDSDEPAYILALNVHRRHLTKGQRAMTIALSRLETRQSLRAATPEGLSFQRVGQAAMVIRHAPDLVEKVLAGASLDEAYVSAQQRKERQEADDRNLQALRQEAPSLAAQVESGTLSLAAALAAAGAIRRTAAEEAENARVACIAGSYAGWPNCGLPMYWPSARVMQRAASHRRRLPRSMAWRINS